MARIPAVIVAGGQARRMGGGDKPLRVLAGRPMLAHVIARIGPQAGPLALNANGDPARFAAFGLPVLPDPVAGFAGPLAGVLAAMDWAAGIGADRVLTVAGDTPFLPDDLVARLVAAAADGDGAVAATDGPEGLRRHPVCGLWPVVWRAPLRAALARGERRIGQWAEAQGAAVARFAADAGPWRTPDPFLNVNTPEDLALAERLLAESDAQAPAGPDSPSEGGRAGAARQAGPTEGPADQARQSGQPPGREGGGA